MLPTISRGGEAVNPPIEASRWAQVPEERSDWQLRLLGPWGWGISLPES